MFFLPAQREGWGKGKIPKGILFQYPVRIAFGRSPDRRKDGLWLGERILFLRKKQIHRTAFVIVVRFLRRTAKVLRPFFVGGYRQNAEMGNAERLLEPLLAVVPPVHSQLVRESFLWHGRSVGFKKTRVLEFGRI